MTDAIVMGLIVLIGLWLALKIAKENRLKKEAQRDIMRYLVHMGHFTGQRKKESCDG